MKKILSNKEKNQVLIVKSVCAAYDKGYREGIKFMKEIYDCNTKRK